MKPKTVVPKEKICNKCWGNGTDRKKFNEHFKEEGNLMSCKNCKGTGYVPDQP